MVSASVSPSVSPSVSGNVLSSVSGNVSPSVLGNVSEYDPERRRSGTRVFQVYRDSIPHR